MNDRPTDSLTSLDRLIRDGLIDAEFIEPGVPTPTVRNAASALGVSENQIIKSLLFQAKNGGDVVLVVLSGASRVSRKRLRDVTGWSGLELADAATALRRTGYPTGGTPPVGHASTFPVIVDNGVMDLPIVFGGGGRVDSLLRIAPDEIVRVTHAKIAHIAE